MESIRPYSAHWLSNVEVPLANKFYSEHGFRGKAKRHEPCVIVRDEHRAIVACGYVRNYVTDHDVRDYNEFKLLAGVAVAPEHQGKGIARLLVQQLSKTFDAQTYAFPYDYLCSFYRSCGFQQVSVERPTLAVNKLYQGYRHQGREITLMVYQPKIS